MVVGPCVLASAQAHEIESVHEHELAESAAAATARIAELSALVEQTPDDVELLVDLGNVYYENNMLDQALSSYERAAEVDSTHVGVKLNMGSLLADLGQFESSIHQLTTAFELEPENVLVAATLGSAYYGHRQYTQAVDMYRVALEIDPENIEAHFNLGVAFADVQMFDEAIREWEQVIAIDAGSQAAVISRENIAMIKEFRGD
jgi:tetratricopeptide (TPR) repeat protein